MSSPRRVPLVTVSRGRLCDERVQNCGMQQNSRSSCSDNVALCRLFDGSVSWGFCTSRVHILCTAMSFVQFACGSRLEGDRRRLEGDRRQLEGDRRRLEGNRRQLQANQQRLEGD